MKKNIPYILYNNRSQDLLKNFMFKYPLKGLEILKIEKILSALQRPYNHDRLVKVDPNMIDVDAPDILFKRSDLEGCAEEIEASHKFLLENKDCIEYKFLTQKRGLSDKHIKHYKLGALSAINNYKTLEIIGATVHPTLRRLLTDGIEGGGILFPLYEDNKLVNVTIRKISDVGRLKYSQSIPDLNIWGLETLNSEQPLWIVEGLFDMMALHHLGQSAVSVSGAMWSSLQLAQLLLNKISSVYFVADKDITGRRCAYILSQFFNSKNITTKIFESNDPDVKDPSEHVFEKKLGLNDLIEKTYDPEDFRVENPEPHDIIAYLSKRTWE